MTQPNFIFIMADNLGYGDWGCYGSTVHATPHTDRMAQEGMRLTHFYSCSPVCTPARAGAMTGCYPRRVGMHVGGFGSCVLMPRDNKGLNPGETTIARLLQDQGYATACVGKWHLGDQLPFLPTRHGFDHFFGIPYSDDMMEGEHSRPCPPLPLMQGERVIEAPVDRDYLTKRCTEEVVRLIHEYRDQPFFIYFPQPMPGSTDRAFASPAFAGRSANGPYGDSIEEMDWSTGQILEALREAGVDERTLVMSTSDHGPVPHDPPQGGVGPLKGKGYTTSEGGMRIPCVARWPGRIAPGSECDAVGSLLDVFPTFAHLAGIEPPREPTIDGHDMRPLLFGEADARSEYDRTGLFHYQIDQLQAVRSGPWKLYLPLAHKRFGLGKATAPCEVALYDLVRDVDEAHNVAADHPDVVARLTALAEQARQELGDGDQLGSGQRPAGWIDEAEFRLPA
ncbi:MAG: sulfatase [Phycisphaeraceae bacterium]